jgi:hypothetical protein
MSVTTYRPNRTPGGPAPEPSSDHNFIYKVVVCMFLVVLTVAVVALVGWAALPWAFAVLLATSGVVLYTTERLLEEEDACA